jgi:hypothetical protein
MGKWKQFFSWKPEIWLNPNDTLNHYFTTFLFFSVDLYFKMVTRQDKFNIGPYGRNVFKSFDNKLCWNVPLQNVCFCVHRKSKMAPITGHSFSIGHNGNRKKYLYNLLKLNLWAWIIIRWSHTKFKSFL